MRRPFRLAIPLATLLLLAGCGGDARDGVTDPPPADPGEETSSIAVVAAPSAVVVEVGGAQSLSITVTRSGDFNGAVNLSLEGAPAGVAGTVSLPAGTSTSTLTLGRSEFLRTSQEGR